MLNYTVTSNDIHLLVFDAGGREVMDKSMHLVAGRTAQEYSQRKTGRVHFGKIATIPSLSMCGVY
nr:hypothetical protein [Desulfobacterales bacterium]